MIGHTDWSLTPAALELVLSAIEPEREWIVECGSGLSTVAMARVLAGRGRGRVHALEHDPVWAKETRRQLAAEGVAERALVIDAPLRPHPLAEPGCLWYDRAALPALPERIDLLLVDGPPAGDLAPERGRYPALPALADRLAPGAIVILDDAGRPGERWVLERWRAEHGLAFERRGDVAIGVCCPQGGDRED